MDDWVWPAGIRPVTRKSEGLSAERERERERESTFDCEAELPELSRLAFRVAFSVLRNREDAEEVAQEALLAAHRKLSALRSRESLRSWLARIAFRRALDRRRGDTRRERREQEANAPIGASRAISPEDAAARAELRRHVWHAIDELPEKQRRALVLAAIEEHDLSSVAALLDLPVGTVKSRLHAARRMLLEKLKWTVSKSKTP